MRDGSWGEGKETYGQGNSGDPAGARDPRRTEGGGGEPSAGRGPRQAGTDEWERMTEELDESDIRACGGFLPLGRTGLASGTLEAENRIGLAGTTLETENGSGLAGGAQLEEGSGVDAGLGGNSPETRETASCESVTNEPNFDENVNLSNFFTDIGITTNSGVDSGLDKREIDHDFDGGETDGDDECGEALRVPRPPTPAVGEPHTTDCGDSFPVRSPPPPPAAAPPPRGGRITSCAAPGATCG